MADLTGAGGLIIINEVPLGSGPKYRFGGGDLLHPTAAFPPFDGDYQPLVPQPEPGPVSLPTWFNDPGDLPKRMPPSSGGGIIFYNVVPLDDGPFYQFSGDLIQQTVVAIPVAAEEYRPIMPVLEQPRFINQWELDPGDLPFRYAVDDGASVFIFSGEVDQPSILDPGGFESGEVPPVILAPPNDTWDILGILGMPIPVPPPIVPSPNWWNDEFPTAPTAPPDDETWFTLSSQDFQVNQLPNALRPWQDAIETPPAVFEPDADIMALLRQTVPTPVHRIPSWWIHENEWIKIVTSPQAPLPHRLDIDLLPTVLDLESTKINTRLQFIGDDGFVMPTPTVFTAGETGPIMVTCLGGDDTPENLATAQSTTLRLVNSNTGAVAANSVALTAGTADGTAIWTRLPAEVAVPGDYRVQVKVIRSDQTIGFFPDAHPSKGNMLTLLPPV